MPVPIIVALPVLAIPAVAIWEAVRSRTTGGGIEAGESFGSVPSAGGGGSAVTLPGEAAIESPPAAPGSVIVPSPAERLRDVVANLPDEATQAIGAITAALDRRSAGRPIPEGPREVEADTAPDPASDRPISDTARREPVEAGAEPATAIERIRQAVATQLNRGR